MATTDLTPKNLDDPLEAVAYLCRTLGVTRSAVLQATQLSQQDFGRWSLGRRPTTTELAPLAALLEVVAAAASTRSDLADRLAASPAAQDALTGRDPDRLAQALATEATP